MSRQSERLYHHILALAWRFNSLCDSGACGDFSLIDLMAMRTIQCENQCPVQTVGKRLGITKSGATRVVKRLVSRGVVAINESPDDGRIKCLSLTDEGHECLNLVKKKQSAHIAKSLSHLGNAQSRQMEDGIQSLLKVLPIPSSD
ncbi:MarR family winged helix-turn-helix transcriptional regulator [Sansalvadorimonas verongulae]|uniref:MarR family winged helix-turn-helix transcriptional regulator n=1 Tax=Sansalvadorimonas verongulae TaxID=2172824 RepID=UPI0012BBE923|nr:MarR family transcriptional regulator [Sansalvadorimonas verongulae]MTI13694.1 MarR family transcriptional regulator [Sansalvadorimonas verongulae]